MIYLLKHEIMEEDEVNTHMTDCCYVEKLNDNLAVLMWLDLTMENIKVRNLVFPDLALPASVFDV